MAQHPTAPSSILAVIAVYHCALAQSQSACSFLQILKEHPGLAQHFSLVVYDNSPQPQSLAPHLAKNERDVGHPSFPIHYVHDPANGGLAAAYNYALARATAEGHAWLLLLDQDTLLTHAFVDELVKAAGTLQAESSVGAIAPKLVVQDVVHSPALPFIDQMRGQFRRRAIPLDRRVKGVQQQPLFPYNSAATLRVSALQAIGGFPAAYWLDFLDHAVFHRLFSARYQLYVLCAALVHESSYADPCSLPLWRFENVLASQALFLEQHGGWLDRWLYRIWLLRHSWSLRRSCKNTGLWRAALRQALRLRTEHKRLLT